MQTWASLQVPLSIWGYFVYSVVSYPNNSSTKHDVLVGDEKCSRLLYIALPHIARLSVPAVGLTMRVGINWQKKNHESWLCFGQKLRLNVANNRDLFSYRFFDPLHKYDCGLFLFLGVHVS